MALDVSEAEEHHHMDLGTTNSAVPTMEGGKPPNITNAERQGPTPIMVMNTKNGNDWWGRLQVVGGGEQD